MSIDWQSVEDIEDEFDLGNADGDLRELRRRLRARLKDVHPDTNNGAFGSDGEESDFHRIKAAIEFVDKRLVSGMPGQNQQALIVASDLSEALVHSLSQAREKDHELERARQLQTKQRQTSEEIASEIRKKYRFYKIVAGVLAIFFGFLTLAPTTFESHPVFRTVNDVVERLDFTLGVLFIYLFIASSVAILYLAWEEGRELKRKKGMPQR